VAYELSFDVIEPGARDDGDPDAEAEQRFDQNDELLRDFVAAGDCRPIPVENDGLECSSQLTLSYRIPTFDYRHLGAIARAYVRAAGP